MATSAPSSLFQSGHAGWRAKVESPTNGRSIRSGVLRLVLSGVIGMSFFEGASLICCPGNLQGSRDRKKCNNLIKMIGAGDDFSDRFSEGRGDASPRLEHVNGFSRYRR